MKPETRTAMKGYLNGFIQGVIETYRPASAPTAKRKFVGHAEQAIAEEYLRKGSYKPFHLALLPIEVVRISAFVNGFETSLGNAFEECARLFALERFPIAKRGYKFEGQVHSGALVEIERLLDAVGDKAIKNNYPKLIRQVVSARGEKVPRRLTVDLFLQDEKGNEYSFEIKGPKPNKGQAIEVTGRLLRVHAIRGKLPPKVRTYYAMAYNPYGTGEYKHSISKLSGYAERGLAGQTILGFCRGARCL